MAIKNIPLLVIFLAFSFVNIFALEPDSISEKKKRSIGILPAIAFDSDLGFQYGALANIYWYGTPSTYPKYQHSLYVEASKFTAGSSLTRIYFDSEQLLKRIRSTFDVTFIRDQMMDFYGFNGYKSIYNQEWENNDYLTRAFYKHHRDLFRVMASFKGPISTSNKNWEWIGGITFFNFDVREVDFNKLNLPDEEGLYEKYIDWGIIDKKERNGGSNTYLKAGLSHDSRDFESNPSKGYFSELFITSTPSFLSSQSKTFSRITAIHRHYISLIKGKNIFAYRILYQKTIQGKVPFYLLPHITSSSLGSATSQGLGGSKTLRGIKRNRVVGDGIILANIEVRQMLARFRRFKQDFYIATNVFTDMGMVVQPYELNLNNVPENEKSLYFSDEKDRLHVSLGIGLKIAMNENFIVSIDYGSATNEQDGDSGLYINLNYLF